MSIPKCLQIADAVTPFSSTGGRPFVRVASPVNGSDGYLALPLRSAAFRNWFLADYFARFDSLPSPPSFRAILDHLEAQSLRNLDNTDVVVSRRVSSRSYDLVPTSLLLDLANSTGEFVDITPDGWSVTTADDVPFETSPAMSALPAPIPSPGDPFAPLQTLHACLNLPDRAAWLRCLAWLLAAFRPCGPYPVLILQGPPGSGKTLAARILRTLVDPSSAPLAAIPGSVRDLVGLARRHWALAFDHVSTLSPNVTDALCRLSTGFGITLHEELRNRRAEPVEQTYSRPVLLTVTDRWTCPDDLAAHALVVDFQPLPPDRHRTEIDILNALNHAFPEILGALCSVLTEAIRGAGALIQPAAGPHCADALAWAIAAAPALGSTAEEMRDAFAPGPPPPPIVDDVRALLRTRPRWTGTATQLKGVLPSDLAPQVLSRQLTESEMDLADAGIGLNFRRIRNGVRLIDLTRKRPSRGDDVPSKSPDSSSPGVQILDQTAHLETPPGAGELPPEVPVDVPQDIQLSPPPAPPDVVPIEPMLVPLRPVGVPDPGVRQREIADRLRDLGFIGGPDGPGGAADRPADASSGGRARAPSSSPLLVESPA